MAGEGEGPEAQRIDRRLAQWKAFYSEREQGAASALKTSLTSASGSGRPEVLAQAFTVPSMPSAGPAQVAPPVEDSAATLSVEGTPDAAAASPEAPTADPADGGPRMLLVDVVLLSTQELMSTSKGVNLLNALTLQLGSVAGNLAAY